MYHSIGTISDLSQENIYPSRPPHWQCVENNPPRSAYDTTKTLNSTSLDRRVDLLVESITSDASVQLTSRRYMDCITNGGLPLVSSDTQYQHPLQDSITNGGLPLVSN